MTTARELLPQLKAVKRVGDGYMALCPAHEDRKPSLSITENDGKVLTHCHAGCAPEQVWAALRLETNGNSRREVATYDYRDETGKLLYQSVRYDPKDFRQRRPDGHGGWNWNLNGTPRVLYRFPELAAANPSKTVLIVEGEKDCDRLAQKSLLATTNAAGAGKWRDEYNEALRGRKVAIIPDNDEPGRKHAAQVAESLLSVAASVKVLELPGLPEKGDVSDWLDAGGTFKELRELVVAAVPFELKASLGLSSDLSRFNFTTLGALLAEPTEQIAYAWDRTCPCGGFSIIAAKPKVGKSTMARSLCLSVSRGELFLGRATKQGKVIYLCLEEKRAEVAEHFRRMGATGSDILIHTGATPKDALTALETAIEEYSPSLVVIDPLSRFVRVADFNSYGEVTRVLEPLVDLARLSKCQTHIMALHHNGKGGDMREAGDAVMGSTAFYGVVDALLTMRKREKVRTVESNQRYGEDLTETIVHLDEITGIVSACGDMKTFTLNDRKRAVMEVVNRDPLSEGAIKELAGGTNGGLTSKAVRSLFEEGKLTRTGAGKKGDPFLYCLADLESGATGKIAETGREKPGFLGLSDLEASGEWGDLTIEEQEARAVFEEANKIGFFASSEVESFA